MNQAQIDNIISNNSFLAMDGTLISRDWKSIINQVYELGYSDAIKDSQDESDSDELFSTDYDDLYYYLTSEIRSLVDCMVVGKFNAETLNIETITNYIHTKDSDILQKYQKLSPFEKRCLLIDIRYYVGTVLEQDTKQTII